MFVCGDGGEEGVMNFQSPTEKAGASQNLYPHNYDHHQTTLATTNGERTQDITRRTGGVRGEEKVGVAVGGGLTEIHYVVPTSFISTRSRDGAPGVPALGQRAPPASPLPCESVVRCEPGPSRRSIN